MRLKHYKKKSMKNTDEYSDVHMTPTGLAHDIVNHFNPTGRVLEPCRGDEPYSFYSHSAFTDYCEIREGKDFFDWEEHVDWIITNPPYSIYGQFLEASLSVADNVVFAPIKMMNILSSKKRLNIIKQMGFGIKEIIIINTPPKPWPQTGFQYCAFHMQRGHQGDIKFTDWT